jgi:hypothetical protein
MATAQF